MSLDPVNRINQMMEVLRREMAESTARADKAQSQSGRAVARNPVTPKSGLQELRARLHERLRALDPQDPRRQHKARRLFLEVVLAQEFGNEFLLDRRFDDMLDNIQETISTSPELDARFSALLEEIAG
jgi:hypothetical protein